MTEEWMIRWILLYLLLDIYSTSKLIWADVYGNKYLSLPLFLMTWLGIGNRLYIDVKFILQKIATFSQFSTPKIVAAVSRQQMECACVKSLYKCTCITFVCMFETINKDVSLHWACFAKYFPTSVKTFQDSWSFKHWIKSKIRWQPQREPCDHWSE